MGSEGKLFERCDAVIAKMPALMVDPKSKTYIKTEREGFEVLHPNIMQVDYQKRRTRRDINLKARKLGFSTWKELEGLFLALYVEGFNGAIVSYDNEQAKDLLSICKNAYDRMPEPEIGRASCRERVCHCV